jgi:serine/threonine-protein kinase
MGALKGKLQYMSPEQAWGKPVDARSDIFSLGSLLFEMLTGERLFAGDSEISVLEAVRQCRIRAPRDLDPRIPEDVERAVLKALEQDPDRRFPTAGQMQHDLEEILYALRPAPSQADLADYLLRLAETEEAPAQQAAGAGGRAAPAALLGEIDLGAAIPEAAAPAAAEPAAAAPEPLAATTAEEPPEVEALAALGDEELEVEEGGSRGKRLLLVVILLLLVAGAAAGYWLWARGSFQDLFPGGPGGSEGPPAAEEGTEPPAPTAVEDAAEGEQGAGGAPEPTVPETAPDGGAASSGSAAEPAPAPAGSAGARRTGAAGAGSATPSADELEAAVSQVVARREKALRQQLEQQEKDLERKLAEAGRGGNGAAAVPGPSPESPGSSNPAAGVGPPAATETATEAATSPSETGPETGPGPESVAGVPEGAQPAAAAAPSALQPEGEAPAAASRQPSPPTGSPPSAPARSGASPATPAEPRVREGDLVGPGPGVEPPVLVRFEKPQYPPMARRLRVEGEVILSILVDETGNVVETHVAKGVRQAVGINEAAIEAARGAQFRPATKGGVRVKMWTTLRIPFKL